MKRIATITAGLVLLSTPAEAQNDLLASCAGLSPAPGTSAPEEVVDQFRFFCGQIVTAVSNVQPSVGIAFSGGAHTLGTAATIGRRFGFLPRVAVTARVNGAFADVPDLLDDFAPAFDDEGRLPPMGTIGVPIGSLQGDVTVGVWNGVSLGPRVGGLGAVDLLGSASYVPALAPVGLADPIVNVGVGARVGILQQGLLLPGISVSGMYRTLLGDVTFGDMDAGDPAEFSTSLSTLSLRAGVSKGFLMLDLAAGAGYDVYRSDVAFDFAIDCPAGRCDQAERLTTASGVSGDLTTAAWNVYGNVGVSFVLLNIVAEVGYQKATDVVDAAALRRARLPDQLPTTQALEGGRFFAGIGARLTL